MLRGGFSHARRKWDIFSIWMNGMGDFLNFTPGFGTARLTSLHSTVPSFNASSKSPGGSLSPNISSIQVLTSFAACGVYRDIRSFFISWSSDVTEGMVGRSGTYDDSVPAGYRGSGADVRRYGLQSKMW
jgi:hypothetical protein